MTYVQQYLCQALTAATSAMFTELGSQLNVNWQWNSTVCKVRRQERGGGHPPRPSPHPRPFESVPEHERST